MSCMVILTFLAALAARQTDYRGIAVGAVHDVGSMSDPVARVMARVCHYTYLTRKLWRLVTLSGVPEPVWL